MKRFNSFKDLIVWQKSMDLTVFVYSNIKKLPQLENFGLISQMQRSVVSIPSKVSRRIWSKSNKRLHQISANIDGLSFRIVNTNGNMLQINLY